MYTHEYFELNEIYTRETHQVSYHGPLSIQGISETSIMIKEWRRNYNHVKPWDVMLNHIITSAAD